MKFVILLFLAVGIAFAQTTPRRSTPTRATRSAKVKVKRPNLKAQKVRPYKTPKRARQTRRAARK